MKNPVVTIESIATYLPKNSVSNDDLIAQGMDTSDEWIQQRTGIASRHIADETETTAMMSLEAAKEALEKAKVKPEALDAIVVATCTPTLLLPSVAVQVQGGLGMRRGFALDVGAACSGFIYGLSVLDGLFRSQKLENALLIGVDSISRILDWEDRGTAVLFGDGAGAVVARRVNGDASGSGGGGHRSNMPRGILANCIYSDGAYMDILNAPGGSGSHEAQGFVTMDGPALFRLAVDKLSQSIVQVLEEAGITQDEVDWFVPHQANKRILSAVAKRIGLDDKKVVITIDHHGNTSAASVPLAIEEAVADGRIKKGDLILMEAMGAGLAWGASLVRW